MKKVIIYLILLLTLTVSVDAQEALGKIEVFYAKKAMNINGFGRVKPGDMLVGYVTENEIGYHMESKGSLYHYVDPLIADNEFSVAKANVEAKTYEFNLLPVSKVGQCAYFASLDGLKARIFKSDANGHHYEKNEDFNTLGINLSNCYVLSVEYMDGTTKKMFEEPVEMKNGNIILRGELPRFFIPAVNIVNSSYGQDGKLLVDQKCDQWQENLVVAYIGSENALYFEGKLYHITDKKTPTVDASLTSQTLDDLPIADILKLVDYRGEAGDILNKIGYKYVGNYGNAQTRTATDTWSRNCIASKSGQVRQFQNGTSSIVCVHMRMMDWPSLTIEVFNVNARNLIVKELKAKSFVEQKGSNDNQKTFIRKDGEDEVTADMEKSPKGWKFRICPIELGLEEYESSSSRVENNNGSPKVNDSGSTKIYEVVEYQPSFPGGQQNLMVWLSNHITYPDEALIKKIQGRVVVSLIVETDGSISNVNVIQGVDPLLDAEAKRVVSAMPKWNPGYHKGEAVRVRYNIPITFKY